MYLLKLKLLKRFIFLLIERILATKNTTQTWVLQINRLKKPFFLNNWICLINFPIHK